MIGNPDASVPEVIFPGANLLSRLVTGFAAHQNRTLSGGREPGEEDRESFFRKGEAGDWENWFTIDQMHEFDERAGELLEALGYDRGVAERAA